MENNTSLILIETIVRKALRDIQEAPERATRSLVDMALHFSTGRFQTQFFQTAQRMLANENSAYYRLMQHLATHTDHEHLIRFGLNVGYNSCTAGARIIRRIEAQEGFSIPWALFLYVVEDTLTRHAGAYDSLIAQGKALGIYTWFIRADGVPQDALFDLMRAHDDCGFILLLAPESVTSNVLERADSLNHLLVSVQWGEQTDEVCRLLQARRMPYAVHVPYDADNLPQILNDDLLYDAQNLHAMFTAFFPRETCGEAEKAAMRRYTLCKRSEQRFPTIVLELMQDLLEVDTTLSDDSCTGGFLTDGSFIALAGSASDAQRNLHTSSLREILKAHFPR